MKRLKVRTHRADNNGMMHNATTLAHFMATATDRRTAAYTLRTRAVQWAAACTDTNSLLAATELVMWTNSLHAAEVS